MTETIIANVRNRLESAAAHAKGLAEDLAPVADFLRQVEANPLVTSFASVIPGELGDDAMAVLNGLLPILGALGARNLPPAAPPAPPELPVPPVPGS